MWRFVFLVYLMTCWAAAQNVKTSAHQYHNGHGWDIRLAVPGEPGSDYPTLGAIPRTSFSCSGKEPGYYADLETNCQVFRVCTVGSTYGFQSFLCPNGTLFNQAVFVCDWWMNVNCPASEQLFNNNNDKFGNLRLGPQLMKDIKKMLTHPMRNPYEKAAMKSNLIVMQDYKPPFGQLFPNEALIAPERTPNNIYVPAKQVQISSQNGFGNGDIAFAASTPDPRYLPAAFNTIQQSSQRDAEVFQRQRQNGQYVQSNRLQSTRTQSNQPQSQNPFKTQVGQITQSNFNSNLQNSRPTQSYNYNNGNAQYGQKQLAYTRPTQTTIVQNPVNTQRGQYNQQFSQYTNSQSPARLVNGKQSEISIAYSKQQFNSKQEKQPYTYNQPQLQFSNDINGKAGNEAKQNLVSGIDDVPSTVIAKTLTLKRLIQDPKRGSPKSRITVKTWIVKPSKSAKLIEPTPYTYNKPTQQPTQKLIETTPYVYNRPTSQAEKQITELEQPYVYNRPTTQAEKQITELEQPYVYNKPTTPAKQIFTPSREVITTSTTLQPTLSRLYLSPTSSPPTQASRLYLAPTTYNPSSRLYLPPVEAPIILSRQYLAPSAIQQPSGFQSEKLRAAPTTPSPTYALPNTEYIDSTSYSESELSHLNSNLKNLSFSDILTKEKLDMSVSDIVKDTSNYLYTASPEQFEPFRSINSIDYPEEVYLPPESRTDSGEKLTSKTPSTTGISKSSRLVASPSVDLEPPVQTNTFIQNMNQLSKLPFYKESLTPKNTIERTVSLKISIPEKIASYLFKNNSESDYDKLEILNTGSSNYLVLTNNYVNKNTGTNFIPIGKLVSDKESNISNSQALVFSLLADSINVAKEYNTAQQDTIQTSPFQAQFQNINNDELAQITNKISQLTSSQYSTNNQGGSKNGALISATQTTTNNERNQDNSFTPNQFSQNQIQLSQRDQYNSAPSRANNEIQTQSSQYQSNNNLQTNSKQLYSGQLYQLPVPDAQQIYNKQSIPANIVQSNSNQQNKQDIGTISNGGISSNADVEIVKSHSIQLPPAARLQASPTSELDHFNSQENFNKFINSNNGISAQLQDKIVGTIPHPIEDNKLVTYKKDESYYVYTKLDNTFGQNTQTNGNSVDFNNSGKNQNAKLIQGNNLPNIVAFQFIPSVSYQLEDEKEQQKILNAFNIDEYGSPKQRSNLINSSNQPVLTTNVDYSVDHTLPTKQSDRQYNDINNLYAGPSSYAAPQASVGRLVSRQEINSKLELEDNSNGYTKVTPSRQFTF